MIFITLTQIDPMVSVFHHMHTLILIILYNYDQVGIGLIPIGVVPTTLYWPTVILVQMKPVLILIMKI